MWEQGCSRKEMLLMQQTKLYAGVFMFNRADVFHRISVLFTQQTLCGCKFAGDAVKYPIGVECKRCKNITNKIEESYCSGS